MNEKKENRNALRQFVEELIDIEKSSMTDKEKKKAESAARSKLMQYLLEP